MAYKKRIDIRIETNEVLIMRRRTPFVQALCLQCNKYVFMLTIEEAARAIRESEREIYRRVEEGQVHFIETSQGKLLICVGSLAATGQ